MWGPDKHAVFGDVTEVPGLRPIDFDVEAIPERARHVHGVYWRTLKFCSYLDGGLLSSARRGHDLNGIWNGPLATPLSRFFWQGLRRLAHRHWRSWDELYRSNPQQVLAICRGPVVYRGPESRRQQRWPVLLSNSTNPTRVVSKLQDSDVAATVACAHAYEYARRSRLSFAVFYRGGISTDKLTELL